MPIRGVPQGAAEPRTQPRKLRCSALALTPLPAGRKASAPALLQHRAGLLSMAGCLCVAGFFLLPPPRCPEPRQQAGGPACGICTVRRILPVARGFSVRPGLLSGGLRGHQLVAQRVGTGSLPADTFWPKQ